ncbi:hypothetical protein B0J11DRAFT_565277 [Dendryphion nanum]|uniref:Uncharacterized protein n=1 Tax=Dendryphion nanum TaxID=256645 RepID=A0A9P9EF92_9PLEO|nr:hypothetical protein B0J11DRAFT_565277 [Dendryphion nanum]
MSNSPSNSDSVDDTAHRGPGSDDDQLSDHRPNSDETSDQGKHPIDSEVETNQTLVSPHPLNQYVDPRPRQLNDVLSTPPPPDHRGHRPSRSELELCDVGYLHSYEDSGYACFSPQPPGADRLFNHSRQLPRNPWLSTSLEKNRRNDVGTYSKNIFSRPWMKHLTYRSRIRPLPEQSYIGCMQTSHKSSPGNDNLPEPRSIAQEPNHTDMTPVVESTMQLKSEARATDLQTVPSLQPSFDINDVLHLALEEIKRLIVDQLMAYALNEGDSSGSNNYTLDIFHGQYKRTGSQDKAPSVERTAKISGSSSEITDQRHMKKRCNPFNERLRSDREKESDEDEEEHPRNKKRKPAMHQIRRLKCPFYQREPEAFSGAACRGEGFADMAKLSCEIKVEPFDEKISHVFFTERLNFKKPPFSKASTTEEKWKLLYSILFPDDSNVPSPYDQHGISPRFEEILCKELEEEMSRQISAQLEPALRPILACIKERIHIIVQKCKEHLQKPCANDSGTLSQAGTTSLANSTGTGQSGPFQVASNSEGTYGSPIIQIPCETAGENAYSDAYRLFHPAGANTPFAPPGPPTMYDDPSIFTPNDIWYSDSEFDGEPFRQQETTGLI